MTIRVIHYDVQQVPNPNPAGETSYEEFGDVRAAILAASQRFGPTGPESDDSPQYWLVDDQYNDELYQYMEVYYPAGWTSEWLMALMHALRPHRGWGIGIAVDGGYLLIFADRLMVTGAAFADATELESVAYAARKATENLNERKYGTLRKQLAYIEQLLPEGMRVVKARMFAHLATFEGYQLFEGNAVWILQAKRSDELYLADCGKLREVAVTAEGRIHPEFCKDFWPYTDVVPAYWLVAYLVEDKGRRVLTLLDKHDRRIATVSIDRVVTVDELKNKD